MDISGNYLYLQLNCDSLGALPTKVNCACYLPAFFSEMTHIEETQPEAYEYLKFGGF